MYTLTTIHHARCVRRRFQRSCRSASTSAGPGQRQRSPSAFQCDLGSGFGALSANAVQLKLGRGADGQLLPDAAGQHQISAENGGDLMQRLGGAVAHRDGRTTHERFAAQALDQKVIEIK